MKNTSALILLLGVITLAACASGLTGTSAPPLATVTAAPAPAQTSILPLPTDEGQPVIRNPYTNSAFGFRFQFPFDWYGPQEYISDQTLRLEVGSDVVYPYGELPEQPSTVMNSYNVVIQYTKNNQIPARDETYRSLQNLKDGGSLAGARSLLIRICQVDLGRFSGFEYIFTLPEQAQSDHVYGREVILLDPKTNDLLTITGQPVNVEVGPGMQWRDVYKTIDEDNLPSFHKIVDSITIE